MQRRTNATAGPSHAIFPRSSPQQPERPRPRRTYASIARGPRARGASLKTQRPRVPPRTPDHLDWEGRPFTNPSMAVAKPTFEMGVPTAYMGFLSA